MLKRLTTTQLVLISVTLLALASAGSFYLAFAHGDTLIDCLIPVCGFSGVYFLSEVERRRRSAR